MELHQLRVFLVIARTGNLTQAARELFASQPAVSAQLKALEDELGLALFERTHKGMKLTTGGRLLRSKATEVCDRVDELSVLAASLASDPPASCRVGLNTSAAVLRVSQFIAALRESAPRLRLELHQGHSTQILADIAQDRLDAGFFFGACHRSELSRQPLVSVELAILGPAAWQERLQGVSLGELLVEPWVLPPEDCAFYDKTLELFRPANAGAPDGITADDEDTMLHLVQKGVGLALLPTYLVGDGDVAIVRETQLTVELGIAWRPSGRVSAPLEPLLDAIRRVFAKSSGGASATEGQPATGHVP